MVADIGSRMPANHAGIARPNAAARGQHADTARTSRSTATMQMASETGSRSKLSVTLRDRPTNCSRQFGTMAEKVADYEKLLKELSLRVNEPDAELIRATLERVSILDICSRPTEADRRRRRPLMLTMPQ